MSAPPTTAAEATIRDLWARIPAFTCRTGCHDCCGPVPWARWEWARMAEQRTANSLTCPYVDGDGRCACYEDRPLMCRMFGAVADLPCPHGCGPLMRLTAAEAHAILDRYLEVMGDE